MVDYTIKNKCWTILEFHGIDKIDSKEYMEVFCWLKEDFIKLCDYLSGLTEGKSLEVSTPKNTLLRDGVIREYKK